MNRVRFVSVSPRHEGNACRTGLLTRPDGSGEPSHRHFVHAVVVLTLALAAAGPLAAQERLVVKGGRILPVSGPPIDGGVIIIRDGKIEAVGKGLTIPSGAKVIDATGKVVVPGYVEVHSTRGMDQVNEQNPNVPFLSV